MGIEAKKYLDLVNKLVATKLKKNNLELVMKYSEFAEVDVTAIKATSMDVRMRQSDTDIEHNEYEVVDIYFSIGNEKEAVMSFDVNNGFKGIYHLDNYWIDFSSYEGTKLNLAFDKEPEFLWLEEILKDDEIVNTLTDWSEVGRAFHEACDKKLPFLQEAQQLTTDIINVESAGIEDIIFTFKSGMKLRVEAMHYRAAMMSYKPL